MTMTVTGAIVMNTYSPDFKMWGRQIDKLDLTKTGGWSMIGNYPQRTHGGWVYGGIHPYSNVGMFVFELAEAEGSVSTKHGKIERADVIESRIAITILETVQAWHEQVTGALRFRGVEVGNFLLDVNGGEVVAVSTANKTTYNQTTLLATYHPAIKAGYSSPIGGYDGVREVTNHLLNAKLATELLPVTVSVTLTSATSSSPYGNNYIIPPNMGQVMTSKVVIDDTPSTPVTEGVYGRGFLVPGRAGSKYSSADFTPELLEHFDFIETPTGALLIRRKADGREFFELQLLVTRSSSDAEMLKYTHKTRRKLIGLLYRQIAIMEEQAALNRLAMNYVKSFKTNGDQKK